jgi:hypothetical protein
VRGAVTLPVASAGQLQVSQFTPRNLGSGDLLVLNRSQLNGLAWTHCGNPEFAVMPVRRDYIANFWDSISAHKNAASMMKWLESGP